MSIDNYAEACCVWNEMHDRLPKYQFGVTGNGNALVFEPSVILSHNHLWIANSARVDSFCKLECGDGAVIGEFVHIASFAQLGIGGGLLICEDGSSFASGVKVITGSNVPGDGRSCSAIHPDAQFKKSYVHVKRNATLFTNSVVCPGVTIGEGAVILPGAVVTKDVPDGETWGGIPAKCIKRATKAELTISSICVLCGKTFDEHLDKPSKDYTPRMPCGGLKEGFYPATEAPPTAQETVRTSRHSSELYVRCTNELYENED